MWFANIVFLFKLIDVLFLFNKIRYLLHTREPPFGKKGGSSIFEYNYRFSNRTTFSTCGVWGNISTG